MSFGRKSKVKAVAEAQGLEPVPDRPTVSKFWLAGHYGRGSASGEANGLKTGAAVPCEVLNSFLEAFVEHNASEWERLFGRMQASVQKEFADELPRLSRKPAFLNVKDFLSIGDKLTWRDFLLTADEVHFQSVENVNLSASGGRVLTKRPASGSAGGARPASGGSDLVAMPVHYDGGRGLIVLGISLWTSRVVRMWHADGTMTEMKTEPGHCYLANFIGVEHQVVHERGGGEAGRGHTSTSVLGKFEAIYFARSATFRHNKCANECRLWTGSASDAIDARLCLALCQAYAAWEATATLELPSLADVRVRRELQASRPGKRRRGAARGAGSAPTASQTGAS